ncbi:hypothetical protein TSMEX_005498, partial [Taenia solium]
PEFDKINWINPYSELDLVVSLVLCRDPMAIIEAAQIYRMFLCLCFIILAISCIITSAEFNLIRLREHHLWLTVGNKMFEVNTRNTTSSPRHILTWFQPEHCTRHRLSTSCAGFITHSTEIEEGLFEICGIMHHKAFCGLYITSAQGMLSAISEKRVADELVNRALEPSLLQHSDSVLFLVVQSSRPHSIPHPGLSRILHNSSLAATTKQGGGQLCANGLSRHFEMAENIQPKTAYEEAPLLILKEGGSLQV